nr:retrotransposon protein, putative, Ty1-copia subclass [Tanacetum cinerariifolium]
MEWYRNLWIVLPVEDNLPFLEKPIPALPVPAEGQLLPPDVLNTHSAWVKASKEIAGLMLMTIDPDIQKNLEHLGAYDMLKELKTLYAQQADQELLQTNYNMHIIGKTVTELHAMLKLHEQTLPPKEVAPALHAIRAGRIQKNQKKKSHKAAKGNQRKGKAKMGNALVPAPSFSPIPKNPPTPKKDNLAKDAICYQCGEVGHWRMNCSIYLAELMKKKKLSQGASTSGIFTIELYSFPSTSWVYDTGYGTHMRITTQGLKGSKKLNPGALGLTPPYMSQMNEVSKRRNQTLLDMIRSMMSQTTLPKSFWDYSLESAAHILNMVPTKKVDKTPYELWHGQAPELSYLKVWSCEALVKRDTLTKADKLEPIFVKCIFVGYPKETMGYSFYYPPENKVFVARNAEFLENSLIVQEASLQGHVVPQIVCVYTTNGLILNVKMQSMKDNEVWELVDLPPNGKTIGHKWLFEKKTDMDGSVHTYKAHLVAKGFTQTLRIDYEETFFPVADIRAIRILIDIAAFYNYDIWKIDVKNAFLNRYLNEEVYTEKPEGFINHKFPKRVCKLKRSIYELKQASRQWNKGFDDEIKKFGFNKKRNEPCVYVKASRSYVTLLIFYVDDILIIQDVKPYLGRCFAMKDLGEAAYILGIKIYRDRSKRLIGYVKVLTLRKS